MYVGMIQYLICLRISDLHLRATELDVLLHLRVWDIRTKSPFAAYINACIMRTYLSVARKSNIHNSCLNTRNRRASPHQSCPAFITLCTCSTHEGLSVVERINHCFAEETILVGKKSRSCGVRFGILLGFVIYILG